MKKQETPKQKLMRLMTQTNINWYNYNGGTTDIIFSSGEIKAVANATPQEIENKIKEVKSITF